ncbi:sulfotransferase family protein [Tsuneonella deserti]|uniref:sulfotransferase family protein n=1 Tax=Tsuneonella deserti TaxID=2035528 RepID=UPI001665F20F
MSSKNVHLLVLGAPRSGTTLLAAMLSCHPDISLLNEELTGASLRILAKPVSGVKLCAPHQIELNHTIQMRLRDWVGMQLRKASNIVRHLRGSPIPLGGFRKSRLSIKDYQRRAPDLHIIGIIRGPEQVISSIRRRGNQSRGTAEYRWRRLVEILYELSASLDHRPKLSILHFDDLVQRPEMAIRAALEFLNLPFDPCVLEGFRHTPQYRGRTSIDPSRAVRDAESGLASPLLERDPELASKYQALCDQAARG